MTRAGTREATREVRGAAFDLKYKVSIRKAVLKYTSRGDEHNLCTRISNHPCGYCTFTERRR